MERMDNKKLLIISSDSSDIQFINAAKELGVYTVCCDRYDDYEISPAKKLADQAWDIDYNNTDEIVAKCKEIGIDGVIAGYGEDRVMAAAKISRLLGTKFYATEEQIEFTRNKDEFKKSCIKNGVGVPKSWTEADYYDGKIKYPVIIKPADNGGRKGISVCQGPDTFEKDIEEAKKFSKNGEAIIEEYLTGVELLSVYTIADGEISLSCLNDKYITEDQGGTSRLCNLTLSPSKYYNEYLETVDSGVRSLLKEMGAKNGVANFQFIATDNGIKAFEMGFRVNGNNDFKVISDANGINFMKMLISYSCTGSMGDDLEKDNPCFEKFYCTYVVLLKAGTIGKVDYTKLESNGFVDDISITKKVGDIVQNTGTNTQKAGMIKFSVGTIDEVKKKIQYIQDNLLIESIDGENMCMAKFDTNRLKGYK